MPFGKTDRIIIRPEFSAVAAKVRRIPSRSTKAAISVLKRCGALRVCEVGCGLLANTHHILRVFPYVLVTDRKEQRDRIRQQLIDLGKKYRSFKGFLSSTEFNKNSLNLDSAILINVLHILPSREERLDLLRAVHQNLRRGGTVFIDSPSHEYYYSNLVKTARPHRDGYAMRRGDYFTFYKDLSFGELKQYAEEVGLTIEHRVYIDHRISFTAKKT